MGLVYILLTFTVIVLTSILFLSLLRKAASSYVRGIMRHEYPGKEFVQQNRDIYTSIIEMRALTDADRAYVIQFHNGHEFLLSNPVWKLTCTHEVVRSGITYEASNTQNVLVSRVAELIAPIISGDDSSQGVTMAPRCASCQCYPRCREEGKNLAVIQVADLPSGFSRYFLENQNIKTIVQCGLSNKHGAFGIVGVDFCSQGVVDPDVLSKACESVCRFAERVQHSLQSGRAASNNNYPKSFKIF